MAAMDVDEVESDVLTDVNTNNAISNDHAANQSKQNNTISNPNANKENNEIMNLPKVTRKRKRSAMAIDKSIDLTVNSEIPVKKRKIEQTTQNNQLQNERISEKWDMKYKEYSLNICEHFVELKSISLEPLSTMNTNLFKSASTQSLLSKFQTDLLSKNGSIETLDLNDYIELISKLVYGRNEGLSSLCNYVCSKLVVNDSENVSVCLQNLVKLAKSKNTIWNLRECILKTCERKVYGIKSSNKKNNEKEEELNGDSCDWKMCRLYHWECFNVCSIDQTYRFDNKERNKMSAKMRKYGVFCKKYDQLKTKKNVKLIEKEKELEKINDNVISWINKQKQMQLKKEQKIKEKMLKKEKKEKEMREKKEQKRLKEKEKEIEKEMKKKEKETEKEKAKEKAKEKEKQKQKNIEQKKTELVLKKKESQASKKKERKQSDITCFFKKSVSKSATNSPKKSEKDQAKTGYQKMFYAFKPETGTIYANIHRNKFKNEKTYAIPNTFATFPEQKDANLNDSDMQIENSFSILQIESENKKSKKVILQYLGFYEDNRPSFLRKKPNSDLNIRRLRRNPFLKMDGFRDGDYMSDDSGIEWYDDVDDLDDGENLDDVDDDEEAIKYEIEQQKMNGKLRNDGFEHDEFIADCDSDTDVMREMKKLKNIENKYANEYPVMFPNNRQRGDPFDEPITVILKNKEKQLTQLCLKKSFLIGFECNPDNEIINDIEIIIEMENRNDKIKAEKNEKKKKLKKKQKRKEKKKKKKLKLMQKMKMEKEKMNVDMEMETETETDEKNDKKNNTNVVDLTSTQPKLTNFFVKSNKKAKKEKQNEKNKKKKRKIVPCVLID